MPTPDAEAIVGKFLRDDERISDIVGDRVSGRTPSSTEDPWIRVTQIFDEQRSRPLEFHRVEIQFDCFAGSDRNTGQEEASLLARTAREVLDEMAETGADGANVTGVTFGPLSRVPDSDFQPERERYVFTANVFLRPA